MQLALNKVEALERELLKMPQAEIVTIHEFPEGKYERTIIVPPWTVLTGAAHKTPYHVRLEQGSTATDINGEIKTFSAPCEFDAPAGVKRAGCVFEEGMTWTDVYDNPDNCQDLAILEARLYEIPDCGLAESRTDAQRAQIDYTAFLHEAGMTAERVHQITNISSDLIDMPPEYAVELKESNIHGMGLFASKSFKERDLICAGRIEGKRTPGGRYINHSPKSNVMPVLIGDDIYAVATRDIAEGEELLVDYRDSHRVNFGLTTQGELT
jgi:hypothetical protein